LERTEHLSTLERGLRLFANVQAREGITSMLLVINIVLVLMAYYFIKPVREGWLSVSMISGLSSLEVKAYSAFGQSVLLLAVLPLYAKLSGVWTRRNLMLRVGAGFAALLIVFWALQPGLVWDAVPFAGIAFYMFVGIFSVTLVAQFWSFAADIYGEERGKRLFPLVAVGASAGAVLGSWLGERLISLEGLDAFDLILCALLPLGAALALSAWIDQRGTRGQPTPQAQARWTEPASPSDDGPYDLIFRHRYLVGAAALMMVFSWIVTSGDNILFGLVQQTLSEQFRAASANPEDFQALIKQATTEFYGELYFWVNLSGLILQAFFVSRILRYGGFAALIIATPLVSLAAYAAMAIAPVLGLIQVMKVAENASLYSVNNTARHLLWLPTTKEMLYKAKTTVDTLFVRVGDGMAALTVLIGTRVLHLEIISFVFINIGLVLVWIALAIFLTRENRRWHEKSQAALPATH
jgi:AAA family ATP:ADP antiporter